jgi:hypothetical protein
MSLLGLGQSHTLYSRRTQGYVQSQAPSQVIPGVFARDGPPNVHPSWGLLSRLLFQPFLQACARKCHPVTLKRQQLPMALWGTQGDTCQQQERRRNGWCSEPRNETLVACLVSYLANLFLVYNNSWNFSGTKEIAIEGFEWKSTRHFSSWRPSLARCQEVSESLGFLPLYF